MVEEATVGYVIYNAASKKAFSANVSGNYNSGVTLEKNASGGFDSVKDTEVWKISEKDADGNVTITDYAQGRKLSMDVQYNSTPFDKVNDKWELTAQENGSFYK